MQCICAGRKLTTAFCPAKTASRFRSFVWHALRVYTDRGQCGPTVKNAEPSRWSTPIEAVKSVRRPSPLAVVTHHPSQSTFVRPHLRHLKTSQGHTRLASLGLIMFLFLSIACMLLLQDLSGDYSFGLIVQPLTSAPNRLEQSTLQLR